MLIHHRAHCLVGTVLHLVVDEGRASGTGSKGQGVKESTRAGQRVRAKARLYRHTGGLLLLLLLLLQRARRGKGTCERSQAVT